MEHTAGKGYSYYCTHCGKKLNSETVLFDMAYLLTGNPKERFDILRFRLTEAELLALYNSGTEQGGGDRLCTMTLLQLLGYMANENNLDLPELETLTMGVIEAYIQRVTKQEERRNQLEADDNDLEALLCALGVFDGPEEEAGEDEEEPLLPIIEELLRKASYAPVNNLRHDFTILRNAFKEDTWKISLRLVYDQDDQGRDVLHGIWCQGRGVRYRDQIEFAMESYNRVCPRCGKAIYSSAGTGAHKIVTLLGDVADGKTGILLALASYANRKILGYYDDPVWDGVHDMSGQVKSVEAVIAEELIADAWNYTKGIPPRITYARIYLLDSRSVTFRIIDSHDHVSFVTVIEISHWLPSCHHGGVDRKDIAESLWQEYPEIVESDVLVLCLDNQKLLYTPSDIVQNDEDLRRRERLLADIDHIQRVCQEYRGDRYYIPVLRIYTKCRELEYPEEYQKEVLPPYVKSQAFTSLLAEEQWAVTRNPTRSIIERMYQNAGNLSKGYSAAMRCSAYGHDNSGWWSSEKNGYEPHPPQPKNIHLLMQWLLTATGCIPVELEGVQCRAGRRQFRAENPAIDGDDFREEALLRQYLFENVGAFDVEVTRADSVLKRLMLRARMNRNPNGNHN